MKNRRLIGLAVLVAVFAAGCWQKSVHPFFTAEDLAPEEKILGVWLDGDEKAEAKDRNEWLFKAAGEKRYALTLTDDDSKKYEYDAWVFRFGTNRFMDVASRDRAVSSLPAHHLFKIVWADKQLNLHPLSTAWVRDWLKEHPAALEHVVVPDSEKPNDRDQDDYILTATTKKLQQFMREHMTNENFFADPSTLRRR